MRPSTIGKAALMLAFGLANPVLAQQAKTPLAATGTYPARQVDGSGTAYYAMFPGGVNYGLSGTFPTIGGYGYGGYGPGPQFGAFYPTKPGDLGSKAPTPPAIATPKTSANLDHLAATLRQASKKPIGPAKGAKAVRKPVGKKP